MMMVIVDTNVAVVANGNSAQASNECVETCIHRLQGIMHGETKLVLDMEWKILGEYSDNLHSRAAGVGNEFLEWCLRNRTNPEKCELVWITPVDNSDTDFREFPYDPALQNFDPKDRKFIAVALAHPEEPPILEATDTEWWELRDAFCRNGVTIEFICEDDIRRLHRGA